MVGWQGATTLRAHAREEKQRRQRAAARLDRVRSALTQVVNAVVGTKLNVHLELQAETSGQLPNLACIFHAVALYGRIAMNFMHLAGELSAMAVLRGL